VHLSAPTIKTVSQLKLEDPKELDNAFMTAFIVTLLVVYRKNYNCAVCAGLTFNLFSEKKILVKNASSF
jgi:hypothetical protein